MTIAIIFFSLIMLSIVELRTYRTKSSQLGAYGLCLVLAMLVALSACAPKEGPRGADGAVGKQGETGEQGPKGDKGDAGDKGDKGDQGNPGVDPTPTTIVKLCPGFTQFNSIYVEVALCIQGKLYGVYSANGGFMTEIVPGTYFSDGVGNSCNVTVSANCQVSW
jgi:hypothetical protein